MVVSFVLAIVSALASGKLSLSEALAGESAGAMAPVQSYRIREAVLAVQVALALALLTGAAMLGSNLLSLGRLNVGFDPAEVTTFSYDLPSGEYSEAPLIREFEQAALSQIESLPGIEAVGVVAPLPMEMGSVPASWSLPSELWDPSSGAVMAHMRTVSRATSGRCGYRCWLAGC